MSSKQRPKADAPAPADAAAKAAAPETDSQAWPEPFKAHPRLFVLLLLAWAAWMAVLLMLYFQVAYPNHLSLGAAPGPPPIHRSA